MGRIFQLRTGTDQRGTTAPVFHLPQVREESRPADLYSGALCHQNLLGEKPAARLAGRSGTGPRSAPIQTPRGSLGA